MLEPDEWPRVLANVSGTIVRGGSERVSTTRLLDLLDVGSDPALRQKVGKRLVSAMRRAGWSGPRAMRIPGEPAHAAGSSGCWRSRSRSRQPAIPVEADVEGLSDELPEALEAVTRLGLRKLARVLRTPLDATDASLTRNQITAAGIAVNAQLRADEQRLRAKTTGDVLARLLAAIEAERARQNAAESVPQVEGQEDVSAPRKPSGGPAEG
jgi:hypothetical protein